MFDFIQIYSSYYEMIEKKHSDKLYIQGFLIVINSSTSIVLQPWIQFYKQILRKQRMIYRDIVQLMPFLIYPRQMSDISLDNCLIYPRTNIWYIPTQMSYIFPNKCLIYPRTNVWYIPGQMSDTSPDKCRCTVCSW